MGRFHDGGRVHQPGQTEPIINVLVVAEVMIFPDYENNYSMFMYFVGACHFKRKKKNLTMYQLRKWPPSAFLIFSSY